jgi:hypothetical protein
MYLSYKIEFTTDSSIIHDIYYVKDIGVKQNKNN